MGVYSPETLLGSGCLSVMEYRPYALENMIVRDVKINQEEWKFVIDPGTQRWMITKPIEVEVLKLSNGKRTVDEIATPLRELDPIVEMPFQFVGIIESLFYEGFLFNNAEEHQKQSTRIYNDTDVSAIHLEITNTCNLRCSHCYLNSGELKTNELSLQEIKDIIDYLPPMSGSKICLTGGEPLMHKDIFEIIEYAAAVRGLSVDLYTNATLIDDKIAARLKELSDRSLYNINFQISLEGHDPVQNDVVRGKGNFKRVMNSIKILTNHGLNKQICLFICLTKNNIHDVPEMIKMAEKLDVNALKFSQWQKQGRAAGDDVTPHLKDWVHAGKMVLNYPNKKIFLAGNFFADLKNEADGSFHITNQRFPKFGCHLKLVPRVDCQGNVWPCQLFVDPEFIVGNTREEPLANIFIGKKYRSLFSKCLERIEKVSDCAQCEWKDLCGCGCPGFAYAEYGDINYKDCFCDVRKYWFEEYIKNKISDLT